MTTICELDAIASYEAGNGFRTGDIFSNAPGTRKVNTKEIGDAIIAAL